MDTHNLVGDKRSLQQWMNYIQTIHARSIDLSLDRVEAVYSKMNISLSDSMIITIGGTNGKGSSQALLDSIYRHNGNSTASYSSPHLIDYNERIKINNIPVEDKFICHAFETIESLRGDISLTYFEFGTLAAFWIFANAHKLGLTKQVIDVILLEVGMGGRQDAVNIITPDLVLITNIGMDHTQWLGNTRESIAYEKAGLFKSNIPVVCNDLNPPQALIEEAQKKQAPLYLVKQNFQFRMSSIDTWRWQNEQTIIEDLPKSNIDGECQLQNAAAVLTVVQLLCYKINVKKNSLESGLQKVALSGRLQNLVFNDKTILLDVAHNVDSMAEVAKYLMSEPVKGRNIFVLGMLSDKDIISALTLIKDFSQHWYLCSIVGERSGSAQDLAEVVLQLDKSKSGKGEIDKQISTKVYCFNSPVEGFKMALKDAEKNDRIAVIGSFHTVGDVMKYIRG